MDTPTAEPYRRELSTGEEIANSITHGIGALLSIVALIILIIVAGRSGDIWHLVSFSIYGSTLILLYLSSTLYHSFTSPKFKNLFARFDHISIFLLIAGTYTPYPAHFVAGNLGMDFIRNYLDGSIGRSHYQVDLPAPV